MRCIDCTFDLTHSCDAARCPECGRAFDPGDAGTYLGERHSRFARRLATAPGWPMCVVAGIVALATMRVDFGPSGSFGPALIAGLVALVAGAIYLVRLAAALFARYLLLPTRTPSVVPTRPARWLAPLAIALAGWTANGLHLPRAVAFWLDAPLLEPTARGPALEPSDWAAASMRIDAWSGTVTEGAVWLDVEVWAFESRVPSELLETATRASQTVAWPPGDPLGGAMSPEAFDCYTRRNLGERDVPGTVELRLPRLAVFPIEGTGYGNFNDAAWAYAPGAPEEFGVVVSEPSLSAGMYFHRMRGDWYRSWGWIHLEDRKPSAAMPADSARESEGP